VDAAGVRDPVTGQQREIRTSMPHDEYGAEEYYSRPDSNDLIIYRRHAATGGGEKVWTSPGWASASI
jgi:hypothetical protein